MTRERLAAVAVATLAVLALGAAAATLDATTSAGGGGESGSGSATGSGDADFGFGGFNTTGTGSTGSFPVWLFQAVLAVALVASLVALFMYYREHGLVGVAKLVAAVLVVQLLVLVVLVNLPSLDLGGQGFGFFEEGTLSPPGGGTGGDSTEGDVTTVDPPVALLALLGLLLVGALATIVGLTDDDVAEADQDEDVEPATDVAAVGRAAGRAADRIAADADVSNEVYRAWREMTQLLEVDNPRSATPVEFADAATAAGLAEDDVGELTALFAAVRYGDEPATEDREQRALASLRRIERTYTDGADG